MNRHRFPVISNRRASLLNSRFGPWHVKTASPFDQLLLALGLQQEKSSPTIQVPSGLLAGGLGAGLGTLLGLGLGLGRSGALRELLAKEPQATRLLQNAAETAAAIQNAQKARPLLERLSHVLQHTWLKSNQAWNALNKLVQRYVGPYSLRAHQKRLERLRAIASGDARLVFVGPTYEQAMEELGKLHGAVLNTINDLRSSIWYKHKPDVHAGLREMENLLNAWQQKLRDVGSGYYEILPLLRRALEDPRLTPRESKQLADFIARKLKTFADNYNSMRSLRKLFLGKEPSMAEYVWNVRKMYSDRLAGMLKSEKEDLLDKLEAYLSRANTAYQQFPTLYWLWERNLSPESLEIVRALIPGAK